MKAVRQYEFGSAEKMQFEDVAAPEPGPGQVRISVRAAGVHLLDTTIRKGDSGGSPVPLPELPFTPGREVAGVVDALGEGVDAGWLGRGVVTHLGLAHGGYAEQVVREVVALHEIPDGLDFGGAVAMIGTGRTTVGILDNAALTSDDVVLVTAAAGGIGGLLTQAAHHAGATVVGVAGGPDKVALVRRLGADVSVDYTAGDWAETVRTALNGRDVTVVFDGVGGAPGRAAFDLLGFGGRMIIFGYSAGEATAFTAQDLLDRALAATVVLGPRILSRPGGIRALEEAALAEAAAGRMVPTTQAFPLADAAAAHEALEGRATVGKVVLIP